MTFDRATRNLLARMVGQARERLRLDTADQLRGLGFQDDGSVLDLDRIGGLSEKERIAGIDLRAQLEHFTALESGSAGVRQRAAYDRLLREIGFTTFNRLAALRMAEERGLVVQCVGRGLASNGFQLYEKVANGALGSRVETYRAYLECLFDELAQDLPLLFDRGAPESRVFPSERCLEDVLGLLNDSVLVHIWNEDEAIGWVYQYYNDPDERRRMREASQAPRNSRELAVRNQFFTPRYVVEFLTDNTLGRLWYEMRLGQTRLTDQCRYLVARPHEVDRESPSLRGSSDAPQQAKNSQDSWTSQARPKKDPRDIRVLDPACGSGHFLLYAFDLLETIYEEAWADQGSPPSESTGRTLCQDYPDFDELVRQVPRLILSENLHGVDIDPRACQIAALALWLRAQRRYQQLGVRSALRPPLTRGNVVVAEPMPGERQFLVDFVSRLEPPLIGKLVDLTFERMQQAGEAGTLLSIETQLQGAISEANELWSRVTRPQQPALLLEVVGEQDRQLAFHGMTGIAEETFWGEVEQRVIEKLAQFAAEATNGPATQRRLFAEDAARGFDFIEMSRKQYDVVLMNPPFGNAVPGTRSYMIEAFPRAGQDLCAAFVDRWTKKLTNGGLLGAITTRTALFIPTFSAWRRSLLHDFAFVTLVDLGYGVLDAMVETAMYVIERPVSSVRASTAFISALSSQDKQATVNAAINRDDSHEVIYTNANAFLAIPGTPLAYWIPEALLNRFIGLASFESAGGEVRVGIQTSDDPRFLRLRWEVPPQHINSHAPREDPEFRNATWAPLSKGGEYSPWWDDIHLLIKWRHNGHELKNFYDDGGKLRSRPQNLDWFFKPGLTYPYRTTSAFGLRCLPIGCAFSHGGWAVFPPQTSSKHEALAVYNSRVARYFMEVLLGQGDASVAGSAARNYGAEAVGGVPWPGQVLDHQGIDMVEEMVHSWRTANQDESTAFFTAPHLALVREMSLKESAIVVWSERCKALSRIAKISSVLDRAVMSAYEFSAADQKAISREEGDHPTSYQHREVAVDDIRPLLKLSVEELNAFVQARVGSKRFIVKKAYYIDRFVDLVSHAFGVNAESVIDVLAGIDPADAGATRLYTVALLGYCFGVVMGRWDVRVALDPGLVPVTAGPFEPLPVCAPGMLLGHDGLPADQDDVATTGFMRTRQSGLNSHAHVSSDGQRLSGRSYPILVPWEGIVVDDPAHEHDVVRRVQEVLSVLWPNRSDFIEQEACEILGSRGLRDYFRGPTGFFADHLAQHSKSRRQAPLYWPLSTGSGSYTVWIYYHRLRSDTLYIAVNKYVDPKISTVERSLREAESKLAELGGREGTRVRQEIESARTFFGELRDFREELLRLAALPYRPNLNDGVIVNAAPLHKLFRSPKWARDARETWTKLEQGDYDWAHLAYTIWPDRVRERSRTDRSLAIAHDIEHLYAVTPAALRRGRTRLSTPEDKEDGS